MYTKEECEEMPSQEPEVGDVVECTGAYGEEVPSLAPGETAVYSQDMDVDVVGTTDPIAIECACSGLISETPKLTTEVGVQTEVEVDCDKTLFCKPCGECKYTNSLTAGAGEGGEEGWCTYCKKGAVFKSVQPSRKTSKSVKERENTWNM